MPLNPRRSESNTRTSIRQTSNHHKSLPHFQSRHSTQSPHTTQGYHGKNYHTSSIMQIITVVSILSFFSAASSLAVDRRAAHSDSTISPRQFCGSDGDCFGGANCCSGSCQFGSCRMDGTCDASNDCYGFCGNDANAVCQGGYCQCSQGTFC